MSSKKPLVFNYHPEIVDKHAFLSPSRYHWINYDEDKLVKSFKTYKAKQHGTRLHELAEELIHLKQRLPKLNTTLNLYVNDAIGFRMSPEIQLYYSPNCFGTADAIIFKDNKLRIHDLKTGKSKTSMKQLETYAAIFCLEYNKNPKDIEIELRIYQLDKVVIHEPDPIEILRIMAMIISSDKKVVELKAEV